MVMNSAGAWQSRNGERPLLDNCLQKCSFSSDVGQHQQQHKFHIPASRKYNLVVQGEGYYPYGGQKTYQFEYAMNYANYPTTGWIPPAVINSGRKSHPQSN